jgi:ACS family sodium-dependent inorganic phosphate cotransporter
MEAPTRISKDIGTNAPNAIKTKGDEPLWPWLLLVILTVLASIVSYADRTNIGIAIIPMSQQFQWDAAQQGLVLGAFMAGYLTTQVLGGWLSDAPQFGAHAAFLTLAIGAALWSVFTVVTPVAAHWGLGWLVLVRIMLGVGEGVGFPAIHSIVSRHVPLKWRNASISCTNGGCYLGSIVALLASAPIAADPNLGWPSIFYLFGSLGALWLLPWIALWALRFARHPNVNRTPHPSDNHPHPSIPWRRILTHRAVWALLIVNAGLGWGFWTFTVWMPTYFAKRFGMEIKSLGWASLLPSIVQSAVSFGAGFLGDYLTMPTKHRGPLASIRVVRLTSQTVSLWMASLFMLLSAYVARNIYTGIVFFALTMGFHALSTLGANSSHLDLCPQHAGILFGIVNTFSIGAGLLGTMVSGYLLKRTNDNWAWVFAPTALISVLVSVVWILGGHFTPIDVEPRELRVSAHRKAKKAAASEEHRRARKLAKVSSTSILTEATSATLTNFSDEEEDGEKEHNRSCPEFGTDARDEASSSSSSASKLV